MIDVDVRDFQSITHATIRIDGFTALVGKSNIGKSAFVRAVKAALTGAGGSSFVRHSTVCARRVKNAKTCDCQTTVHIRTKDFDLKWEKGDKVNRYHFNGQVYDRTEQGTPDFLLSPLLAEGFDTVDVARKSKLLQVADQFDNVFLLDQTGNSVADVLSDVARLDRINVATRLVEKDRKEANSTRKVYEREILENTAKLASYAGLDALVGRAAAVDKKLGQIQTTQADLKKLAGYLGEIEALGFRVDELQQACNIVPPDTKEVLAKRDEHALLSQFFAQFLDKATVIRALAGVDTIQDPNITPLADTSVKYNSVSDWVGRLKALQEVFNKAKPIDGAVIPTPTEVLENRDKLILINSLILRYQTLTTTVSSLETDYSKASAEELTVVNELKEFGVCPTCTQPLDQAHGHSDKVA